MLLYKSVLACTRCTATNMRDVDHQSIGEMLGEVASFRLPETDVSPSPRVAKSPKAGHLNRLYFEWSSGS